jgi:small subunit ribosomal protein S20
MAHSLSAQKRIRQNLKRAARNRWRMKRLREAIKDFRDKVLHASLADATASFRKAARVIDRTAQKGVIHKNAAARRKSRMSALLVARKKAGQIDAPPPKK